LQLTLTVRWGFAFVRFGPNNNNNNNLRPRTKNALVIGQKSLYMGSLIYNIYID